MLKNVVKKIISLFPLGLVECYLSYKFGYDVISYSQHGEDAVLNDILVGTENGFYVDVGAHHPTRLSNTYRFYRRGWRGINIDATPGSMELFDKIRPRDINIETAVSDKVQTLTFYQFVKPAFNTFSASSAEQHQKDGNPLQETVTLQSRRLDEILDQKLPSGQHINFLTIDVEGLELEVLRSNNWAKYMPDIIVVEDAISDAETASSSPVFTFLREKGYHLIAYTGKTMIFDRRTTK